MRHKYNGLMDKKRITTNSIEDPDTGCWEWQLSKTTSGYGYIRFGIKNIRAHRLSYALYYGLIPALMCVCHRCDNPGCVNPDHLWLGTQLDNIKDRDNKGRTAVVHGQNNPFAKLTELNVYGILALLASGVHSTGWIAGFYSISPSSVGRINRNESWKHIDRGQFAWD